MKRRLSWELRYRRDQFSIEAGRAKGRPDPEWFLDRPELLKGEELFMESFWTLTTERQIGGQAFGPIPHSKVRAYALDELGLAPELVGVFCRIIAAMDGAFLDWQGSEHARYVRSRKPAAKKSADGKTKTATNYGR